MWIVGHFIKDNSVEVVPQTWIVNKPNEDKECLWPPITNKKKLFDCVKNKDSPDCSWKAYPINILGRYDNLQVAQQKCNKARDTDDLSSTSEEIGDNVRRFRKQNEYSDYLYDYDPDRPSFPKSFLSKKSKSQNISESSESEFDYSNTRISKSMSRRGNTPEIPLHMEQPKKHNQTETSDHETLDNNIIKHIQELINKSEEFHRQVIKEIFMIKCIVKENREVLVALAKKDVYVHPAEDIAINKNLTMDLIKKFPLSFSEDLLELEEQLENDVVLDAMSKELALIGGEGIKEMTIKVLYYIMTNKFASYYSWEGKKGKKVFKSLKLASLIIKTIRVRHAMATETEIVTRIKSWLVQAKFRENLKMKRSEQKALMSANNDNEET